MREGAWVGRAPAGSGSGRHVEEGGCRRLERRGVPLCFAADSPSSEPARGDEPRPVSLVPLAAQRLSPPPAPARPPARPPSGLAPSQARERSPASTSYLSSPGCSLAPSPAAPSPGLKSLAAFVRQLKAWDEACADGRSSCWFETEGDLPRLAGEALLAEAAATGARRIAFDAVAARLEATAAPPPPLGTALAAWPTGWGIEEGNFCGLAHWAVEVWHAAGSVDASRWQVEADGGRLFFVRVAEKAA